MAKTPPKKFISSVDVEKFIPVDAYMVIRNPLRKASLIITNDDDVMTTKEPSLVISVGRYVADVEPGMEVYFPSDAEGLKIQEETIRGMVEKTGLAATLAKQKGEVVETEEGIIGYYDYYVMDRNFLVGYRDLREKTVPVDES